MSLEKNKLKEKILELEKELQIKTAEVLKYRYEIAKTNEFLEKIVAELGHELKYANLIQKVLTPTEIPNIPGIEFSSKFIPGTQSGGDYFDVFEHEDKMKFGILISSSSGYAMSALFLSILIKMSSKIEARKGLTTDYVLQLMAKELVPNMGDKDKASIFYGIVDRRTFTLTHSCVGNIAVFLKPHNQEKLVRIENSTEAFSKNFQQNPLEQSISLDSRDRIVICTKGLFGAVNKSGEAFGYDRIAQAITKNSLEGVHDVRNEILFQVEQFSELREPLRDQLVLVIEVKDRVIKLAK